MDVAATEGDTRADSLAKWGLVSAVVGLVALFMAYWLVLPAVVFGSVGVVLGWRARRRGGLSLRARDMAMAAVCLGAVAVLFTPVTLFIADGAEDWGRDCALDPDHDPNCPDPSDGDSTDTE